MSDWDFPFGDFGGVASAIIFIVFALLSALGHLASRNREEPQRPGQRPGGPPRPPSDPLAEEIREFLERAQRRRAGRPAGGPPRPVPPTRQGPTPAAEFVEPEVVAPGGSTVAQHVSTYLGTPKFGQVGSQDLGWEVAQSDDRLEAHLHEKFDHQIGTLASAPGEAAQPVALVEPTSPADRIEAAGPSVAALATMLANPQGMRQAIVLSEILRRPEERWS